jgi:hypothetical protein
MADASTHRQVDLAVHVDQTLQLGKTLSVRLTDTDSAGIRGQVSGQLLGGPEDGAAVHHACELRPGSALPLGTLVVVRLVSCDAISAKIRVTVPEHLDVSIK